MEHPSRKQPQISSPEVAMANEVFDLFCNASTLKSILGHYRHLCDLLKIKPNNFPQFYPKLKSKLRSWKAQALWKKFDQRANHKCYNRGKACPNTRVLIIGGGPCGLRSAIEAQLLGSKVVVVEKRDRMSRNNVLHLWPFVIQDLRSLGAKKFFGKFCAGSIDHISIRQLQCILLKVALILGVEFHENVSFDSLIPPPENQEEGKIGWRVRTTPADHPVSQYEFDVLIGADGKRNTLEGFKRKEFRGKLAIAITANFINKRTEAEARVEEISGVAFIFNQKFFKELYHETGIDLENIVYYKDDTHYFVMTAKKHSLIDKGVILQDHADTAKLLAKENVDRDALMLYAREAAEFSTEYQMMDMEFAVNHYGQPDVAMFDFTSMYAAENASRVLERNGHRLLMILVGDSLLEPFWPTGSGCARGFLSSLDACWAIKGWGTTTMSPLEVIAERESIYRLLGQTTPENLNRDYAAYTLDPHTRYPNLNIRLVTPIQVRSLWDTDDPESIKQPILQSEADVPKKRRRRDSKVHPDTLLHWLKKQVALYDTVHIENMGTSFKDGLALCAIIHRYRPDLIDFQSLNPGDIMKNNQLAFDILEKELGISPMMTATEMMECDVPDKLAMFSYLTQIYEAFRGEIPHIKHPKLEPEMVEDRPPAYSKQQLSQLTQLTAERKAQLLGRITKQENTIRGRRSKHIENAQATLEKKGDTSRRSRKRRSNEKMGATVEERQKRLEEIAKNRNERTKKRQYLRKMATQQFYKSLRMLQANAKRDKDEPFEDYSIFLYRQTAPDFKDRVKEMEQKILHPDREPKIHAGHRRGSSIEDDFWRTVKSLEDKFKGTTPSEKKPRDLLRAIGKIEKTDWNVKEIEKKIEENKMGRGTVRHDNVEKVPKWSREQVEKKLENFMSSSNNVNDRKEINEKVNSEIQVDQNNEHLTRSNNDINNNNNNNDDDIENVNNNNSNAEIVDLQQQKSMRLIQFLARQTKMEKKGRDPSTTDPMDSKYAEIDSTLKTIDKKIKEGNVLGHNKVSAMAEQFSNKTQEASEPRIQKSNSKVALVLPAQGGSETCHFCNKRVYLMERLTAEGKYFHRGCFRCEYCSTSLRIGNHTFDRERNGGRFYCTQHFGLSGNMKARADRKKIPLLNKENIPNASVNLKTPEKPKSTLEGVTGLDLLDRGQTPERIEFENLAGISDTEEIHSQMDEDEWTDRNFGASAAEMGSSDDVSDMSDSDDDNEVYEEAIDQPLTTEGTLELAKNWTLRYSHPHPSPGHSDTGSNEYEDSTDECSSEDEKSGKSPEDLEAQISRLVEIWAGYKTSFADRDSDTSSETEVASDDDEEDNEATEKSEEEDNSATEISTDSEFEHDGTTPTQHNIPEITINDCYVRKTRGNYVPPKKVQVKSHVISSINGIVKQEQNAPSSSLRKPQQLEKNVLEESNANLTGLRSPSQRPALATPLINPRKGDYLLNRTHSTEGIASKLSLELKKRYLLGSSGLAGNVMKSGSMSNVDTKLRSFTDSISQHQKLLNPAPIPSPSMQAFLQGTDKLRANASPGSISPKILEPKLPSLLPSSTSKFVQKPPVVVEEKKDKEEEEEEEPKNLLLPDLVKESVKQEEEKKVVVEEENQDQNQVQVQNQDQEREREQEQEEAAPLHETISIVVPQVDWKKNRRVKDEEDEEDEDKTTEDSEIESDSLSSSGGEEEEEEEEVLRKMNLSPPRLQIHSTEGHLLLDEETGTRKDEGFEPDSIECMSRFQKVQAEEKQDTEIEKINNNIKELELERKTPTCVESSGRSTPSRSSKDDETTGAFTETEFSEWARDNENPVAKDLVEDLSNFKARIAKEEDDDLTDVSSENEVQTTSGGCLQPNLETSKVLLGNNEDIDFMDTDTESLDDSLQDATNDILLKNRGYVEFVNVTSPEEDSQRLLAPGGPPIAKFENENDSDFESENSRNLLEAGNVIEMKTVSMDDVLDKLSSSKQQQQQLQMEEDSLLIVEPEDTTTTSELTTILSAKPLEKTPNESSTDYLEYVKRLQSRIAEFSNAKDSIDVRKSKKRNWKRPEEPLEEDSLMLPESPPPAKPETPEPHEEEVAPQLSSPGTSRKLEELTKERSKQRNLIQDLLMDKLEAQKQKSAEKRAKRAARNCTTFNSSPGSSPLRLNSSNTPVKFVPMSIPSPQKEVVFATPVAPPRSKHEEAKRTAEKAKQDARERAKLKSDEELGLSPEDKLKQLRLKVTRRQLSMETPVEKKESSFRQLQVSKSTDNVKLLAGEDFLLRKVSTKSMEDMLVEPGSPDRVAKKKKDPERRKSIIQAVSDFFKKKDSSSNSQSSPSSPPGSQKLSMFRLKSKNRMDKSLSPKCDSGRPKSVCESMLSGYFSSSPSTAAAINTNTTTTTTMTTTIPPPIPPPPLNYSLIIPSSNVSEDSLSDEDSKATALSISHARTATLADDSCNSITRKARCAKRAARQAQLKRLRMAQEIQRKLEETEVKQRELESRGVNVEKALRGEGECSDRKEADLLREWFDLMRERTELRRYEKELLVRAQEVQLEDRHERLQQELRERLADDDTKKTSEDVKKEGEILTEMLEIVSKRDSLIALLEEERQRYQDEDKDLEAQMLAKGLRLTPLKKSDPKYSG